MPCRPDTRVRSCVATVQWNSGAMLAGNPPILGFVSAPEHTPSPPKILAVGIAALMSLTSSTSPGGSNAV